MSPSKRNTSPGCAWASGLERGGGAGITHRYHVRPEGRVPGWCGLDDPVTVGDGSGPYILGQAASSGAFGGLVEINWTIGGEI